ncbi:PAS domain S-box protein [Sphingobacterium alkalisoli]|uniref:histidine kinase n=1 Tax=Sphingobacterium alkalisoli TaxID=1874115 RepID=A0A4U0H154_9SPHI|nr:PAS domain S-box protein [Sphingobacterium alkalisoli]TJY63962.1 PAS domain S-box protein [Sphingobacterium alkalisoli]GGH23774.1 hypothetical protein GCM10011418_31210 [Sphingobacterium alkalisoli]
MMLDQLDLDTTLTALKYILDNSREGIVLCDKDSKIRFVNHEAEVLLSVKKNEWYGKGIATLFQNAFDESEQPIKDADVILNSAISKPTAVEKVIGVQQNGEQKKYWFSLRSKKIKGSNDEFTFVFLARVNHYKQQLLDVQEELEDLNQILSSFDDIVLKVDVEGYILNYWCNDPEHLFFPPDDFLKKNIIDLFPPDFTSKILSLIRKSIRDCVEQEMTYQSPFDQPAKKWYKLLARPIKYQTDKVIVIVSDITENVELKEETLVNEQKFHQVFHSSGIGMALFSLDGKTIKLNKKIKETLGYGSDDLGLHFRDFTHPDDIQHSEYLFESLLNGKISSYVIEKRYTHVDARSIPCLVHTCLITDTRQKPLFILAQVQDLTRFKNSEYVLNQQKKELEAAKISLESELNLLMELNHIVAHNLRAPASNIQMLIRQIVGETDANERHKYLQLLDASGNTLLSLLDNLVELLEIQQSSYFPFELCNIEIITEAIKVKLESDINEKSAIIRTDFKEKMVFFPRLFIENIVQNLLSNTLKYDDPNKRLEIHIKTYLLDGKMHLSIDDNGLYTAISNDDGELLDLKKIFHQERNSRPVGLYIIRRKILSIGGTITFDSDPKTGNTLTIQFPLSTPI